MKEEKIMKQIIKVLKTDWAILILIALGFALGIYYYPSLPSRVPVHWNFKGEVNGYGSRFYGAFGIPLINLGVYLLLLMPPKIDPKRKNFEGFKSTYQYLKYVLIIFLLGIEVITLLTATGVIVNRPMFMQIFVSLLIILIGNMMGRFKFNYFVGIRTPWTLANEEVWTKTHRLAAPVWVIAGILNILAIFLGINSTGIGFIIVIVVIVVVPFVYSYMEYQKIVNEDK